MIGPEVSHWPKPELNHENVDGENYAFEQPRSTKNISSTEDVLAENRNIQTFYNVPARFVYFFQLFCNVCLLFPTVCLQFSNVCLNFSNILFTIFSGLLDMTYL